MDCNCKGVNTGKLVTRNVDLQFNSTRGGRRFVEEEEERKRTAEVGMLIFLVRNVRFGIHVGWPSANSGDDRLCPFYRSPNGHQRDAAIMCE